MNNSLSKNTEKNLKIAENNRAYQHVITNILTGKIK